MRKVFHKIVIIFTLLFIIFTNINICSNVCYADVETSGVPYKTYTSFNGELRETNTAFVPLASYNFAKLSSPEDMFIFNDRIYVANSGNKNILVFDLNLNLLKEIGGQHLEYPTGVFVKENKIYVADRDKEEVLLFDFAGSIIKKYKRPTEALFGIDSTYSCEKVVVDSRDNIYITGSGDTNGCIQLGKDGNFLGYFGVNKTKSNFLMKVSEWLGIDNLYANTVPAAVTNLAIDNNGLVYTSTQTDDNQLKKYNMASKIMFQFNPRENEHIVDMAIDNYNNIFLVTDAGIIYELDENGNLLFCFGGNGGANERLGLLYKPTGIAIDSVGNIYVVDKNNLSVVVYGKTNFALTLDNAMRYYNEGDLQNAEKSFNDVLLMNESFSIAIINLGKIYLKRKEYTKAIKFFQIAKYKSGYSDAFWEIRNDFLLNNSGVFIIALISILIISFILKITKMNKLIKNEITRITCKINSIKIVRELNGMCKIIRHPLETIYDLQRRSASSIKTATIIYGLLFVFSIISKFQMSFLYQTQEIKSINLLFEFASSSLLFILFVFSNYLLSDLFEGDGKFKDIYIGIAYAISPLLIIKLPISWLSNVLTYNESFLLDVLNFSALVYTAFLIFFTIKDMHNFSVKETIKNLLLTILTMIIIVVLVFIVGVLAYQFFDFIISIVKEVIIRV